MEDNKLKDSVVLALPLRLQFPETVFENVKIGEIKFQASPPGLVRFRTPLKTAGPIGLGIPVGMMGFSRGILSQVLFLSMIVKSDNNNFLFLI